MKILMIVLAVLAVAFFVFKGKIKNAITKKVRTRNAGKDVAPVYTPIGKTRTFNIELTLEEAGNDEIKIVVGKKIIKEI